MADGFRARYHQQGGALDARQVVHRQHRLGAAGIGGQTRDRGGVGDRRKPAVAQRGFGLAAAGGILYALNYPSIDPLMGVMPGLKAFVAAILGGIGNIPGAALGGLILGTVETFVAGSEWSTYKDAIAFAILIIILLFRPAGLLGKFTVEKV